MASAAPPPPSRGAAARGSPDGATKPASRRGTAALAPGGGSRRTMTHNEIGFIQHEGIASNGVAWTLQCPPGTRDYDTDFSADAFYRLLEGDRYELLYRAKGRLAPCPEIGFPGCVAGLEFYARTLDSRRIPLYYTSVRPLAERPVFAQRGWRRRYPTLARTLDAQSRRAAETGESRLSPSSPSPSPAGREDGREDVRGRPRAPAHACGRLLSCPLFPHSGGPQASTWPRSCPRSRPYLASLAASEDRAVARTPAPADPTPPSASCRRAARSESVVGGGTSPRHGSRLPEPVI